MKQLFLSLSLCCLFGAAANANTVTGTVMNVGTCLPASGQKVYLTDTIGTIVDSTFTTSTGTFTMTSPSSWVAPKNFLISAYACGATWTTPGRSVIGTTSTTLTAFICGAPKILNGTIMLGSTPSTGGTKVWLIKVQRNFPTVGDTTLTAVDSVLLANNPNYTFKMACVTDTFLVKAALQVGHPSYANWLPSYDSSLSWSSATRYYGSAFNGLPHYLFMFSGTNPGGAGFIGGSVLVGANKQAGVGDPLAARLIMLLNGTTNAPMAYTYSDAAGKFSFPSVAPGTYKLVGDAWGLYNVPFVVTIAAGNLTVNNIIFEENYGENTFKAKFGPTSVGTVAGPLAGVHVYPNPATKLVSLIGMNNIKGSKTAVLRNIVGAVVKTQEFTNGQPVEIAVDALPAGTYILQLTTDVGTASFNVVK